MATYERGWLRPDVVAAVVIWSVVVPQAVAHAQIAGLPPEVGLMAELAESPDLDLSTVDTLAELSTTRAKEGIEVRLVSVQEPALRMLRRAGLADQVTIAATLDAAVGHVRLT
jgi:MFS superfamily sulfate permease-like transporter